MPHTKAEARRGPAGQKFRENKKPKEGRELNNLKKRRRQEEKKLKHAAKQKAPSAPYVSEDLNPSSPLETTPEDEEVAENQTSVAPASSEEISWSATLRSSPLINDLGKTHDVTSMSVISSSKIQKKAARSLEILSIYPAIPPAKSAVAVLHAKASVASKMISIAEIVKREITGKGGKWYQYNEVGQVMEERKKSIDKLVLEKKAVYGEEEDDEIDKDMESGSEDFEIMKTPFERAIEGQPKVRAVPTMTIYLSRIRIESLRKAFGEQTNGLEIPKE